MIDSQSVKTLMDAVYILHSHGHGPFHDRLFQAMALLYSGSHYAFEMYAPDGSHTMWDTLPLTPDGKVEVGRRLLEVVPFEHPGYRPLLNGESNPLRLGDMISMRQLKQTHLYNDIFKSIDSGRQLILPLKGFTGVGGVTMNRGGTDYSDRDLLIGAMLIPHIAKAHEVDQMIQNLMPPAVYTGSVPLVSRINFTRLRRLGFTRRECEVFCWMAEGKRDGEIAIILNISVRTVGNHVSHILHKLRVETRTAAVAAVISLGGIDPLELPGSVK